MMTLLRLPAHFEGLGAHSDLLCAPLAYSDAYHAALAGKQIPLLHELVARPGRSSCGVATGARLCARCLALAEPDSCSGGDEGGDEGHQDLNPLGSQMIHCLPPMERCRYSARSSPAG